MCDVGEDIRRSNPWLRCIQIFSTRLVLEVWGGAGAIWGFSEVVTLRGSDTLWFWRPAALTVGGVFFCRWLLQLIDYWYEVKGPDCTSQIGKTTQSIRLCQIFPARLVLEVFGGAGAVWGFSEALTLRNDSTLWFWRPIALVFGFVFFIRWVMQILDYVLEARYNMKGHDADTNEWNRLIQIFSARMVLEVWGGAGAIWGFSEVLTLRNSDTLWLWQPAALAIGAIFFYRWLLHIRDFIMEMSDLNHLEQLHKEEQNAEKNNNFTDRIRDFIIEMGDLNDFPQLDKEDQNAESHDFTETKENEPTELRLEVEYGTIA